MIAEDKIFSTGNTQEIWQRYCGFFDLSLEEFMGMQQQLLLDHIETIHGSNLAQKIMPLKPKSIDEFRKIVPLTRYGNYAPFLENQNDDDLAIKPAVWCHTSGRGGSFKWTPYSQEGMEQLANSTTSLILLACAEKKGDIAIQKGFRFLQNLAPPPYMSGILIRSISEKLGAKIIPSLDQYQTADFEIRIQAGFETALKSGVDFLGSLTSVLVKMGERFSESSGKMNFQGYMLHPKVLTRLVTALIRAKKEGRGLLPKDLWSVKGIVAFGMDTSIYREKIMHYWGKKPLETYAASEVGIVAIQDWNKNDMTFYPSSCFLEFIPEGEWLKNKQDPAYQPKTLLLNELTAGQNYEMVCTSFYGMPFLRYRIGDLITITKSANNGTAGKIPQMIFNSRIDDLIDIAGFTRLDEITIHRAIIDSGTKYEDWSCRKESEDGSPVLRLYLELKNQHNGNDVEKEIHQQLANISKDYANLEKQLGLKPLRVTLLQKGSFNRFLQERKNAGADLAHLKPPHMNASEVVIQALIGKDN